MSKVDAPFVEFKLTQTDYELLMNGLGIATGYALQLDVYGLTGSDPNAVRINTRLLDLITRIMEAKDTYQEGLEQDQQDRQA